MDYSFDFIRDFDVWDTYRYGIFRSELVYHSEGGEVIYRGEKTWIRGKECDILTGEGSFIVSCYGGSENYIFFRG